MTACKPMSAIPSTMTGVTVVSEVRFFTNSDGIIGCNNGSRAYEFWRRYLDIFGSVTVVARVSPQETDGVVPVEGPGVTVWPIPDYHGLKQYIFRAPKVRRAVREACEGSSAFVLRLPGALGGMAATELRRMRRPFGIEAVGDPYEVFSNRTAGPIIDPLLRWWFTHQMQGHCAAASAVAYVTENTLQSRYPASAGAYVTHYSSVELPPEALVDVPPPTRTVGSGPWTVVGVGRLAQMYKGVDTLLDAVAHCRADGLDVRLVWAGDGHHRASLEDQARSLGIAGAVKFVGEVAAGAGVRSVLDDGDLFVIPSRTEGLPRALIEAMARGLPCLGTSVGGIPELLPSEDLVPPDEPEVLAHKIREVLFDVGRRERMADRNVMRAREFGSELLNQRRNLFYNELLTRSLHGKV